MAGKWDQKDVPNRGWSCERVDDTGELAETCEMCESVLIRHVHWMKHEDYPTSLGVGCVCAGKMEGNPENARNRENIYKSKARRRANWLGLSGWRRSKSGNPYINKDGLNVVIFRQGNYWSFRIEHKGNGRSKFSRHRYDTEANAQLAAFDEMILLKERGWPSNKGA